MFIIAVIGNVHRGTLHEQIDLTFHSRSLWQLSILRNSLEKREHVIYGDFQIPYISILILIFTVENPSMRSVRYSVIFHSCHLTLYYACTVPVSI